MAERKVFHDSITPLTVEEGIAPTGLIVNSALPEHHDEEMTVLFSLEPPKGKQDDLEAKVARGETVKPDELQKDYSAKKTDVAALEKWLTNEGFEVEQTTPDGTGVYARAKVSTIAKSLDVNMVRVTRNGITYTAAKNAPSLPADVADSVHAIVGLQPFNHAHKHLRRCIPALGNRVDTGNAVAAGPVTNLQNTPPYLVAEVRKAYNADGLAVTGKGQTIAILIDTFPIDSDLELFWQKNNTPVTLQQIKKINVKNVNPQLLPAPEGEETLDASWASGVAPGANIRIYAAGSLQFVDLNRALDQILQDLPANPGMRQLSVSLGLGELFMGGPDGIVKAQHLRFLKLAAAGVNIFVSSGDAGSNPDDSGHSATGQTQAEYAASDSSVVGVGGTTLVLKNNGTVSRETGWTGSGGGRSTFFPAPPWQKVNGTPLGSMRLVPDVSMTADPNKGAFLVFHGQVQQTGGTSWSAPIWAGFCALINEARAKAGKPALPFLNPLIYPLIGTKAFRDVVGGSNGAFKAVPGYDLVTGIGVPNVEELIKALV